MIEQLMRMKGKTFSTLAQNKKFEVLDVTQSKVIILVNSTGNERYIPMHQIEASWKALVTQGMVTQTYILQDIECWSSAFVCGIFANFPNVTYELKPIRLFYKKPLK